MACPYFYPTAEVDYAERPRPARAPLGGVFDGFCHSGPQPVKPAPGLLYQQCNYGYGRTSCPLFPSEARADAVRFTAWKGQLLFILERNYSPVEHGPCEPVPENSVLARQALVFSTTSCLNK